MNYSHDNWSAILAHIGKPEELDTSARNAGALTRRREIRDAGFLDYQIISWNKQQVIIHRENEMFAVHWQIKEKIVITLCQHD
jgi:hypothetical protein